MNQEKKTILKRWIETSETFGEDQFILHQTPAQVELKQSASQRQVLSDTQVKPPATAQSREFALHALYKKYADCQNCPLGKTRNKIVFGEGSITPKVLFIGEGPGYEEDRKGLPFVGKAGELLNKILASIELNRQNSYIANIVKCHPMRNPDQPDLRGNDRPPEDEEMAACREILEAQIEILDPPIIVTLGAVASRAILNTTTGITRLRGQMQQYETAQSKKIIPVLPTYHPAALLRNPDLKRDTWADMKLLRSFLENV